MPEYRTEISAEEMAELKDRWAREEREPTPLPWLIEEYGDEVCLVGGPRRDTIADNVHYYPHQVKPADMVFIASRVNAHDALVAALTKAAAYVTDDKWHLSQEIDAALALARGEK